MKLSLARAIADRWVEKLRSSCLRLEVAGGIRREKEDPHDVEICAIPDRWLLEFFLMDAENAIRLKLNGPKQKKINAVVDGICIDLFIATPETWALVYLIRTGSANYCKAFMAQLHARGFTSKDARLYRYDQVTKEAFGDPLKVAEERDVYKLTGITYKNPKERV